MKYYSEITKNLYDSQDVLVEAENKIKIERIKKEAAEREAKEARANDAKKVDEAWKNLTEARKAYQEALTEFCKKHGAYHKTLTEKDLPDSSFSNIFYNFKTLGLWM